MTVGERLCRELPVYVLARGAAAAVYTPGHVSVVAAESVPALRAALAGDGAAPHPLRRTASELKAAARRAVGVWQQRHEQPFSPECLTLYLSNRCNLACGYCFASSVRRDAGIAVDEAAVIAAARRGLLDCAGRGGTFHLVLHGGGEPTLEWGRVVRIVQTTRAMCREAGIPWFGFLATNGVITERRAGWLAANLSLIEISCDGPPEIQDRLRPRRRGGRSSHLVERTARVLRSAGCAFEVRATITPETVERQTEVVEYACFVLGAERIRFEPVYSVRSAAQAFGPEHAGWFAAEYLKAERRARALGCDLAYAGVRLDELHGPHCSVGKNALHLLPDGGITACFFNTDSKGAPAALVGRWDPASGQFALDAARIEKRRRRMAWIPPRCADCINAYHCARECPATCAVDGTPPETPGFRCELNRRLAREWILEAVADAPAPYRVEPDCISPLLEEMPGCIDRGAVIRQWRAARARRPIARRALPLPVWARRGFDHDGDRAWTEISKLAGRNGPISIYLHIPFCDRRCGFCDCYSLPLAPGTPAKEVEFSAALVREIEEWAALPGLSRRPVTTVHFGGGTPDHLHRSVFEEIQGRIRARFAVDEATEWALESTSSLLTPDRLGQLSNWGFRRLHVGVQTLEDLSRRLIGRRQNADAVAEGIGRALALGFVVSADVVFGLPAQTFAGLLETLGRLGALGVHGISLYELQESSRNERFLRRFGPTRQPPWNYFAFQACDQYLIRRGYRKNHFTHYARPEDANIYYRHRTRNEDLLAMGPTADGVFAGYHYRHPEFQDFVNGLVLEGGVYETPAERTSAAAAAALMGGSFGVDAVAALGIRELCERWLQEGLLAEAGSAWQLTANGSWFISAMLDELLDAGVSGAGT